MCARVAQARGRRILVLEHNDRIGKKILISGGGRCNFTNVGASPAQYLSNNPHFCRSALARFAATDFIALVEAHGIAYYEKTLGQLFCRDSAKAITNLLLRECAGVEIRLDCAVARVEKTDHFFVHTNRGVFESTALVVATGGLSFPKLGASDLGYRIATQFEIPITPCRPALVPLTWSLADLSRYAELAGISCDVIAHIGDVAFREQMLFTHRGISGPAILQISSFWQPGASITLNLLPDHDALALLRTERAQGSHMLLANWLAQFLSRRFAQVWCEQHDANFSIASRNAAQLATIAKHLHSWSITPTDTEGYAKAEVTAGGVDTAALSSKTMESKSVPGLFFIGEVVDVTGWLGGYNFQWAWASGHAAGLAV